jgi:hypothetical protein
MHNCSLPEQTIAMKSHIVSDGPERLRGSKELNQQLRHLRDSIRDRHAAEFSQASFLRWCWLRWRMGVEYRRERKRVLPSPGSLYAGNKAGSAMDFGLAERVRSVEVGNVNRLEEIEKLHESD